MNNIELNAMQEKCSQLEKKIWEDYYEENAIGEPIVDGIVNIEKYLSSKYKILWILKEPYDEEDGSGGGWHFCKDFLSKDDLYYKFGRSRNTWHPIIYVSYGILNDFIKWEGMDYIRDDPSMAEIIKQIAVINVKKLPGLTRTYDYSTISEAYRKHKEVLHLQLKTYNPDIIIGGSTLNLFLEDLEISQDKMINYGCVNYYIKNSKLFISAYHPGQTQVTRDLYVNDIIKIVELWVSKK